MHIITLSFVLLLGMCLGCSKPYIIPTYPDEVTAERIMIPVGAVLDEYKKVDIVFIHGMCSHDASWALEANINLISSLGFKAALSITDLPKHKRGPFDQTVIYKFVNTKADKTVRTYAILWSPATADLKKTLCYDRCQDADNCQINHNTWSRGTINNSLKSSLLDDCLADAVIYTGANGKKIRDQVIKAVDFILSDRDSDSTGPTSTPIFFIAESLGSKILFDALISSKALSSAINNTMQVFMEANQIPLLSLGDLEYSTERAQLPNNSLDEFARLYKNTATRSDSPRLGIISRPQKLSVVAFTDPNDLLSYTLQPSIKGQNHRCPGIIANNISIL